MDYVIQIQGDKAAIDRLRRLGHGVLDLRDPMRGIATYLTGFFSGEVFASRGRVIGEPWAPLNSRYAGYKAKRFPGRPPLVRSGLMIRSFKGVASTSSARISNTAPYFDYQQDGTSRLPARAMMKVDQARLEHVAEIIATHITRSMA